MADDLRAATGAKFPLALNGKTYMARQITPRMWAELHNFVLAKRLDAISEVADKLERFPEKYRQQVIEAAVARAGDPKGVSPEQLRDYLTSPEGTAAVIWLMVRDDAPELKSPKEVEALIADLPLQTVQATIDAASGLAAAKNS